ncbi:type II toxin-antitoxin system PemK/MazF family toxin [Corynebacterium kalinowskii]|nr:hypothetical protein [Corynebacterium kalinowskii]
MRTFAQRRREAKRARLDAGLARLGSRLGLDGSSCEVASERVEAVCDVHPTSEMVRNIYYAPDMDGHAEPGEVVWIRLATEEGEEPRDRAILVVGHGNETILGLLISPNTDHEDEEGWLDIGSGSWDSSGAPCWLCLNKLIEVPELAIRREGAIVPRRRFERIAGKLRGDYGWG